MKTTYTHYFLMGDALSTYAVVADSFAEADSKFGANIVGIVRPGYKIVKDENYGVQKDVK